MTHSETINEIMRLAGLMATARCRRMASTRHGHTNDPRIAKAVDDTTAALRKAVEELVMDASCLPS